MNSTKERLERQLAPRVEPEKPQPVSVQHSARPRCWLLCPDDPRVGGDPTERCGGTNRHLRSWGHGFRQMETHPAPGDISDHAGHGRAHNAKVLARSGERAIKAHSARRVVVVSEPQPLPPLRRDVGKEQAVKEWRGTQLWAGPGHVRDQWQISLGRFSTITRALRATTRSGNSTHAPRSFRSLARPPSGERALSVVRR